MLAVADVTPEIPAPIWRKSLKVRPGTLQKTDTQNGSSTKTGFSAQMGTLL
jgi:hypothetical protein